MSAFGGASTRQRIAHGETDKHAERQRITTTFHAARAHYLAAATAIVDLINAKNGALAGIEQDKGNMEGFVNHWLRSGLIEGKNETERKASLAAYKEADEGYRACAQRVTFEERRIKLELEPEILRHEYEIRLARYDIEFCITEGRMVAGEGERHER